RNFLSKNPEPPAPAGEENRPRLFPLGRLNSMQGDFGTFWATPGWCQGLCNGPLWFNQPQPIDHQKFKPTGQQGDAAHDCEGERGTEGDHQHPDPYPGHTSDSPTMWDRKTEIRQTRQQT